MIESVSRPPEQQARPIGRWIKLSLIGIGLSGVICSAAILISAATFPRESAPSMTYTITRDDLVVTVEAKGRLESAENTELKCKVRGHNTVTWVIESGSEVKAGDELIRLDTLFLETQINERTKYAHWSRSAAERSKASLARAELALSEYLEGRYPTRLMTLEKELVVAESNLVSKQNAFEHAQKEFARGYVSILDIETREFAVTKAELDVEVAKTNIDVLKRFTRIEELETLKGNLASIKSTHLANEERAYADAHRRDRALEELQHCVIKAERDGLVIYPSAAEWKTEPDVAEGATVHKDQVLLLMPDLSRMQVKVGIHEAKVELVKPGQIVEVALANKNLKAEVESVASVAKPANVFTGNVVAYETIVKLPPVPGLKPGMSAEIEVIVAEYDEVITIPVAAVVEKEGGAICWVKTPTGIQRRALQLGASNDVFTVVEAGLREGDEVVLNTTPFVGDNVDEGLGLEAEHDLPGTDGTVPTHAPGKTLPKEAGKTAILKSSKLKPEPGELSGANQPKTKFKQAAQP